MKQKLGLKISKILIRNSDCRVVKWLESKGVEAEFKIVKISENTSTHLLRFPKPIEFDKQMDIHGSYMVLPGNYLWINTESCTACRTFSKLPVIMRSISYAKSSGIIVRLIVPGRLFHRQLIECLENSGLEVESISIREYEDYELTERQMEVLITALKLGYLGSRRSAKLKDIASFIGSDPSTVSRIIRDGIKKIIKRTLDEEHIY